VRLQGQPPGGVSLDVRNDLRQCLFPFAPFGLQKALCFAIDFLGMNFCPSEIIVVEYDNF
jgi:hypothetical protein